MRPMLGRWPPVAVIGCAPTRRVQHGEDGGAVTRRQRLGLAVILVWCALVVLATVVTGRLYLGALLALAFLLALPFRAR